MSNFNIQFEIQKKEVALEKDMGGNTKHKFFLLGLKFKSSTVVVASTTNVCQK